jgi:hypothetical protein
MKFTGAQLKKANKRVFNKYGERVSFNNDIRDHTRVVYETIVQSVADRYLKGHLDSLLNTKSRFDDIYYSI